MWRAQPNAGKSLPMWPTKHHTRPLEIYQTYPQQVTLERSRVGGIRFPEQRKTTFHAGKRTTNGVKQWNCNKQNPRKLSCSDVSSDDLSSNTHTAISLSSCFSDDGSLFIGLQRAHLENGEGGFKIKHTANSERHGAHEGTYLSILLKWNPYCFEKWLE